MDTLNGKIIKLQAKNLYKSFEKSDAIVNVSFNVYDGEFLSILGPSGCGKTTILRMLIGLVEPDSGKIIKDGKDITNFAIKNRKMGIVFQDYALFENMTVLKNVEYALTLSKETKKDARKTAQSLLSKMKLSRHLNKRPSDLSGGQQQRVAIARTLAQKPDIILFDEPMSALDIETRLSLRQELKNIQKEFHTTMIYVTHDQEEAFALSDRIMVMEESKISQMDTPEEIMRHPANKYVSSFVCDNIRKKIDSLKKYSEIQNEN